MSLLKPAPSSSHFDAKQLKRGTLVELEHTNEWSAAETIAKHHLVEDPQYYHKLAKFHRNMKANPTYRTSFDKGHSHTVSTDDLVIQKWERPEGWRDRAEEDESDSWRRRSLHENPVDWNLVGKRVVMPLSGALDEDFTPNPSGAFWTLVSAAGAGLSSYHGYKRNAARNPIAWALWWGLWGSVLPIITLPIAIAQGYAEPEEEEPLEGYGAYYYDV